jgi:hypothetical protein
LVEAQEAACYAERDAALARYYAECERKNLPRCTAEELTISTNALSYLRPVLKILSPVDEKRLSYYVNIVMQIWEKALEILVGTGPKGEVTHPKPNVECITLGVLYFMQTGYRVQGIEAIPYDEYLCIHLPRSSDLPALGIDKRHDTKGTKLLKDMYDSVLHSKVNLVSRIQLQFDQETGKETHTVDGGVKEEVVAQRLFMPTSRRKR